MKKLLGILVLGLLLSVNVNPSEDTRETRELLNMIQIKFKILEKELYGAESDKNPLSYFKITEVELIRKGKKLVFSMLL